MWLAGCTPRAANMLRIPVPHPMSSTRAPATRVKRRKLNLKPKFECGPSYYSVKHLTAGAFKFKHGIHRFNLHCPTRLGLVSSAAR